MKGMCIRLLATVTLLIGTGSSAWAFDFFGLFSKDDTSIQSLLKSVPADTVVFFGGHNASEAASFFDETMATSQTDMAEINALLDTQADTPGLKILGWLMEDYFAVSTEGYQAILNRYGMAKDGAGVFYLNGATPVARYAVADEQQLWSLLDRAALDTGAQPQTAKIEGANVRRWTVTTPDADLTLDLAVTVGNGVATFALLNAGESAERQAQSLGLAEISNSLADAGTWTALEDRYGFDQQIRGYFDIAGITESLLIPANTSLGRDLTRIAPEQIAEIGGSLDAVCRDEMVGLARQVPRFVFGSENSEVAATSMSQSVRMILELTNPQVTAELRKLPGSLPAYSKHADDKLLALALGMDVNALAPVATALWTQFRSAKFDCAQLIEWQAQANSVNPAMLGMVSGMAQGVKGVGAALFSLETDVDSPVGLRGSAMVSLSAENPQTIAALISSSIPGMAGLTIPANGDPVEVPVPVPNLPVFAAIKGKHLVIYTGEPAEAAAESMAAEPLNTRGTTALAMNYQRFGDAMLTALNTPEFAGQLTASSGTGDCTEMYSAFLQLRELPLTIAYHDNYTEQGWEALARVNIEASERDLEVQPGQYRTDTLNYDCSWSAAGTETLNEDGTGQYTETSADGQCALYVNEYRWEQKGSTIVQNGTAERSRDSCDAEWTTQEPQSYDCSIVGNLDNGFYCLYHFDGEPVLMRYTR